MEFRECTSILWQIDKCQFVGLLTVYIYMLSRQLSQVTQLSRKLMRRVATDNDSYTSVMKVYVLHVLSFKICGGLTFLFTSIALKLDEVKNKCKKLII